MLTRSSESPFSFREPAKAYRLRPGCGPTGRLVGLGLALLLPAAAAASTITLTGTLRDFNARNTTFAGVAGHPDFNPATTGNDRGIVTSTLGTDGKPVYSSATAHPTVTSAASFHQWFRNDSTVNRSEPLSLTLTRVGSTGTTYQYVSTEFFPADGRLLNQQTNSPPHNYLFTTQFHTTFTYVQANNDSFSFSGNDDVFVFINNILAIDLGGLHPSQGATVNLNTFASANGLVSGRTYNLDFFQANRRTKESNFTFTTSLTVQTNPSGGGAPPASVVPEPGTLALFVVGLAGLGRGWLSRCPGARPQVADA